MIRRGYVFRELCHTPPACGHLPYFRGGLGRGYVFMGWGMAGGFGEAGWELAREYVFLTLIYCLSMAKRCMEMRNGMMEEWTRGAERSYIS